MLFRSSLSPVALDRPAAAGNGVTAEVVGLKAVTAKAQTPGSINGPALQATVRLTNGTTGPLYLGGVAVELAHGADLTPASPNDDPRAKPFSGALAAGASTEGVYVFTIAVADRDHVTLTVGYQAGAPFLVFTGSAR